MAHPLAALTVARALLGPRPEADPPPPDVPRVRRDEDQVFLVEHYVPGLSPQRLDALTRRLATVADSLRSDGVEVRVLGSAGLPGDEALLSLLSAPSAETAAHAVESAGLAADRIVPVLWRAGYAG